jgi:putative glutamine amidotransferase
MKKIALTQRLIKNNSYNETREALDINWGKLIDVLGFIPIILPILYDYKSLDIDGIILTGGNDLNIVSGDETDKIRDDFEYSLLNFCINKNIPVLGICRGMQVINAYFGGSLKKVENHVGASHVLDNGRTVNSFHNYAIDKLGMGLRITARSTDGIIEELHHTKYNIFGQMHHPERMSPFDDNDLDFMKNLFGGR